MITPFSQVSVEYSSIPKSIADEIRRLPLESEFSTVEMGYICAGTPQFQHAIGTSLASEKNRDLQRVSLNETTSSFSSLRFSGQRMNEGICAADGVVVLIY